MLGADFYEGDPLGKIPLGVGEASVIKNAIIDKNARVGANVRIENREKVTEYDGPNYYIREGIVIVPKNETVEDGSNI
jgi:glucose-1-phosphate adenylyltransferase